MGTATLTAGRLKVERTARGSSSRQTKRLVPGRSGSLIKNAYISLPCALCPLPFLPPFPSPLPLLPHAPYVSTTHCLRPPLSPRRRPRWHRRRPLLHILLPLYRCRCLHNRRRGQRRPQRLSRRPPRTSPTDYTPDMEVGDPPLQLGQPLPTLSRYDARLVRTQPLCLSISVPLTPL